MADLFEQLLDIERNCRAHAAPLPRQIIAEKEWLGIGFRSNDLKVVCGMSRVVEVLPWSLITPVPGSKSWLRGVIHLRGQLLPVTDLQGFITGISHTESSSSRILIILVDKVLYGFAVAAVLGVERFFGEEIKPANAILSEKAYEPYLAGVFERDHQPWFVLKFEEIVKTPTFYHIMRNQEKVLGIA